MKKILFILLLLVVGCSISKDACDKETKECCKKEKLK